MSAWTQLTVRGLTGLQVSLHAQASSDELWSQALELMPHTAGAAHSLAAAEARRSVEQLTPILLAHVLPEVGWEAVVAALRLRTDEVEALKAAVLDETDSFTFPTRTDQAPSIAACIERPMDLARRLDAWACEPRSIHPALESFRLTPGKLARMLSSLARYDETPVLAADATDCRDDEVAAAGIDVATFRDRARRFASASLDELAVPGPPSLEAFLTLNVLDGLARVSNGLRSFVARTAPAPQLLTMLAALRRETQSLMVEAVFADYRTDRPWRSIARAVDEGSDLHAVIKRYGPEVERSVLRYGSAYLAALDGDKCEGAPFLRYQERLTAAEQWLIDPNHDLDVVPPRASVTAGLRRSASELRDDLHCRFQRAEHVLETLEGRAEAVVAADIDWTVAYDAASSLFASPPVLGRSGFSPSL